jgi:hypothetical protein
LHVCFLKGVDSTTMHLSIVSPEFKFSLPSQTREVLSV